jgi:hypothetical protein
MILAQAGTPSASGLTADELFSLFNLAPPRRVAAA